MQREIIRVEPETGEILVHAPFERQVELILEQVKKALEATGSDLDHVPLYLEALE